MTKRSPWKAYPHITKQKDWHQPSEVEIAVAAQRIVERVVAEGKPVELILYVRRWADWLTHQGTSDPANGLYTNTVNALEQAVRQLRKEGA